MDVELDIQDGIALVRIDDGKKNAITHDAVAGIGTTLANWVASSDASVCA